MSRIEISSLDDPRVEMFRDIRDRDLRGRHGLFMAESELVLRRLLRRPERIHALLLSNERYTRLAESLRDVPEDTPIYVADLDVITRIAGFHVHRGVLTAGKRLPPEALTLDAALGFLRARPRCTLLIAEGLTNVDNLGGVFRNAAAFGVDGIVLDPRSCDPLYRKAVRVSMGHVLSVPYAFADQWPGDLDRLRSEWGLDLVAAEITEEAVPIWDVDLPTRVGFVLGTEGTGLSPGAIAACGQVAAIPMSETVPSLNVSAAAGVFLYERRRRGGVEGR